MLPGAVPRCAPGGALGLTSARRGCRRSWSTSYRPQAPAASVERLRLEALRYALNEEAATYVAVMRVFTDGTAGLLSDLSAAEVAERLDGLEIDVDSVDARLTYLVERGNLARSPCETEARSIREYLTTRARYQLTQQRGELVHRQVEELLGATDALWAAAFGPYSCRHLSFAADPDADPPPTTGSWWRPARPPGGKTSPRPRPAGSPSKSGASTSATRRCASWRRAGACTPSSSSPTVPALVVRRSPGRSTCVRSPSGALELVDLTVELV